MIEKIYPIFATTALSLLSLSSATASPFPSALPQSEKPVVKIMATGGTIANTTGGRISGDALVEAIPQLGEVATIRVEEFSRVASGRLTPKLWLGLAKRINQIFATEKDVSGVIVTQGSNTVEETAYFLNLTVLSDKPVVVTGAQRRHGTLSADGDKNLLDSLRVASSMEARGKGVLVVASESIHSARDVVKRVSRRPDTWESPDLGVLGMVDTDQVSFYRAPTRRHSAKSEFDVSTLNELPRVDIIYSYAGADGTLVNAAVVQGKAKGLVVAAFGTGSPADPVEGPNQHETLKKVSDSGVVVVITNRGGKGRIVKAGSTTHPSYISGDNLSAQKARILLMLALAKTSALDEIQRIFDEY